MPVKDSFLIFEDTETTGLNPGTDEVCEIGSILTDLDLNEIDRFDEKIKLSDPSLMSKEAAAVNGYDPEVWREKAVPFAKYDTWLTKHIPYGHVAIPVGHNVSFDRDILYQKYYKPYGHFFKWSYYKIDTVGIAAGLRLAGIIKTENLRLDTVRKALNIDTGRAHSAMPDCEAVKKIFEFFVSSLKGDLV